MTSRPSTMARCISSRRSAFFASSRSLCDRRAWLMRVHAARGPRHAGSPAPSGADRHGAAREDRPSRFIVRPGRCPRTDVRAGEDVHHRCIGNPSLDLEGSGETIRGAKRAEARDVTHSASLLPESTASAGLLVMRSGQVGIPGVARTNRAHLGPGAVRSPGVQPALSIDCRQEPARAALTMQFASPARCVLSP